MGPAAGHGPPAAVNTSADSFSHARHRVASPTESGRGPPGSPAFSARSSSSFHSRPHRAGAFRVRAPRRACTYLFLLLGAVLLLVPGYLHLHTSLLHRTLGARRAAQGAASKGGEGAARREGGKRRIAGTLEETRIHDVSWSQYAARRRHELAALAAQAGASSAAGQDPADGGGGDGDEGAAGGSRGAASSVASSIAGLGLQLPPDSHYLARARAGPFPIKLKYPVLWAGAIFSKSGYGTEAVSYVASLLQLGLVAPEDVWLSQAGDHMHDEVLSTMDPGLLRLLQDHHYHNMTANLPDQEAHRPLIVVCHTFPDCWRTPADDDPRLTARKVVRGLQDFVKYKVLGRTWRDDGCPCPHADIQDQVVYRVGRTMFETEHVPGPVAAYAQYVDEVWVPSEFNRHSFASSGVALPKLHTLAQGINTTLFSPVLQPPIDLALLRGALVAGRPAGGGDASSSSAGGQQHQESSPRRTTRGRDVLDAMFNVQPDDDEGAGSGGGRSGGGGGPFRFLSVFKWEMRKGWDILLRAFVEEFRGEPDVELHIVTKPFFEKVKDFPSYFRRQVGPFLNISKPGEWDELPRVYLYHHHVPEALYPRVYASMDALVIPTRGEGWGRPQIEAMAMGLPVISTNWSGLTAFLDDKVAFPIRVEGVVPVQDSGPNSFEWFQGQRWAQPDARHLRQLMRSVFSERAHAARKGAAGRAKVLKHFSDRVVAHQLLAHLLRVQDVVDQLLWGQLQQQREQQQEDAAEQGGAAEGGVQQQRASGSGFWGQLQHGMAAAAATTSQQGAAKRRQNRQLQGDDEEEDGGGEALVDGRRRGGGAEGEVEGAVGQGGVLEAVEQDVKALAGALRGAMHAFLAPGASPAASSQASSTPQPGSNGEAAAAAASSSSRPAATPHGEGEGEGAGAAWQRRLRRERRRRQRKAAAAA